MRLTGLESELSGVQPILTLYLEANPKGSASRSSTVNSLPWLRKEGKAIEARLGREKRAAFRSQFERVEKFLRNAATGNCAIAIFSGPAKWVQMPLPFAVSNELHWGQPDLTQLRRIAEEQQNACIVAVDRAGARFFRYELGDFAELPAMRFEIEISQWKRKEHGHMARRDTKMPHGPLRDAFKKRMDQQYAHLFRHVSERIKFICAKENMEIVLLVGSDRLTKPIESALPPELQERVVLVGEDLARVAPAKLQAKIEPRITAWMKQFAEQEAARLVESESGAIVGLDETLAELQNGRIGSLVMVRGLDAALRRCVNCGDINRSADPSCGACGGVRREVMLSGVLDDLAKEHHTKIEILDPAAAKKLAKAGGMGGWLRQPILVAAR
jgi:Bacterial archaeo-eukaryotic release factor family 10